VLGKKLGQAIKEGLSPFLIIRKPFPRSGSAGQGKGSLDILSENDPINAEWRRPDMATGLSVGPF
jgi:hypothetical protein